MISVAIDGPSAAGKSTIAKIAAKRLSYLYIDTGALYRSIAYASICKNIDISSIKEVEKFLFTLKIEVKFKEFEQRVIINGEDVTDYIRTEEVSKITSKISALKSVRNFLLDIQRNFAKKYDIIMDGRDIGTVILKNANVKIFLCASAESRAKRRYLQLKNESYEEVLKQIKIRDENDSNRLISPLKPAKDAIVIDTSNLTLDESVEKVIKVIKGNI
jgi:cytidylate kinase